MDQKQLTKNILAYWEENNSFQQSIQSRSSDLSFKFYDGPPFTSGDPHYGHLLQSTVKDMVPRWMTMRGYRVDRKRGWDCHGIPAENYVNKQLGILSKKEIGDGPDAKYSLTEYVQACYTMVGEVNDNRQWFIDHVGRWVDTEHAYFTMHNDYMESVINVFTDLYNKNLIYKGFKVLGYSRSLGTALSNSEIAEGYKDRQDPAVTVKLQLASKDTQEEKDYKITKDSYGEVTLGVLRDRDKICMVYDTRSGKRFIPGGKVDVGETLQESITRELFEEIGIQVISAKLIGKTKVPHHSKLRRLNCLECERKGKFENKEPEKQGAIAWISKISSDNELGYAIKIEPIGAGENSIIDDIEQIQYDFADLLMVIEKKYTQEMENASISMLVWTTTPWTLPSNMFGAVHKDTTYAIVFDKKQKEYVILAKSLVKKYFKNTEDYVITYKIKGRHFVGLSYQPLFDYYYHASHIDQKYYDHVHQIVHADFVTEESGTGIAHEAPAFGEDDYNLVVGLEGRINSGEVDKKLFPAEKAAERLFNPVNDHGDFTQEVPDFAGQNVIKANKPVIENLKERGLLYKHETINHSYPHCPRTKEPLIYRAMESRFVKEQELTEKTIPLADQITFVPTEIKKRFVNGLASAPDWNISRSRFWGTPLPVRECKYADCEERKIFGSLAEIEQASEREVKDLHRPYIDEVTIPCSCGGTMYRIPEVLDTWFDSGSMPYGQEGYIKTESGRPKGESKFTADFIAEGLDQTRGWFRSLHVLGAAYTDNIVYKHVLTTGLILAEDGKKMSKSLKNYPDPKGILEKYGADAFRLYVLGSPVVRGEPLRFLEQGVEQVLKDFVIPLQNVWNFFSTYAAVDERKNTGSELYLMRHAEKNGANNDSDGMLKLSEKGREQLRSDEFRERVLRINPDIILTSPIERAKETAEGVAAVLKEYGKKEVEIMGEEKLSIKSGDGLGSFLEELLHTGKIVLCITHKSPMEKAMHYMIGTTGYDMGYAEIIKFPLTRLNNELDQWILAEIYKTIAEVDTYLDGYELEPATKALMRFMDKLTNWYLRRSRRRFRAEGMDTDKQAAYWTLFEVIGLYCKLAAPFAPFVTEWIWQEMKGFITSSLGEEEDAHGSIHLQYWPLAGTAYINEELIGEISTVRKIIKGAMYLRAKHQIKVKQPLQSLKFKL